MVASTRLHAHSPPDFTPTDNWGIFGLGDTSFYQYNRALLGFLDNSDVSTGNLNCVVFNPVAASNSEVRLATPSNTVAGGERLVISFLQNGSSVAKIILNGGKTSVQRTTNLGTAFGGGVNGASFGVAPSFPPNSFVGELEFFFAHDRALSDAEVISLQNDPYQIFKPANDAPFLVGVAGDAPPAYDESARIDATVTVTAVETFGTTYDETARIDATVTVTAVEVYAGPSLQNNLFVGANRIDALAVGATAVDQAYVGTTPVLNQ